jgi:hypothetical protein
MIPEAGWRAKRRLKFFDSPRSVSVQFVIKMRGSEIAGEPEEELLDEAEESLVPRRPWLLIILSPILAILALWAGTQWKSGVDREDRLRAELKQVYLEAETLRLQAAQAQQKGTLLEQQVVELVSEKEKVAKRLAELEAQLKGSKGRRPAAPPPAPSRR